MRIVWIGAGNLATRAGLALQQAGHETLQVYSRTMESAQALADRLACEAVTDADKIRTDADVYLFSLKDNVLEELVARIAPRVGSALCLHTAGSMPVDIFRGHALRYGVFYPMQTFSKALAVDFREIPIFIEASDADACEQVRRLAASVSDKVMELSTEQRRSLHLSAVFACNFVNHCYALSAELLQRQWIPFEVMLPLIDETARKVHLLSPVEAQTGPAVRYDRNVIDRQSAALAGEPELQELYGQMSRSIHRLAVEHENKNRT